MESRRTSATGPDDARKPPAVGEARQAHGAVQRWLRYTGLGFQMLGSIALGAGLGWWWDQRRADGKPWGILTGSLLGCALAIGSAVRLILKDK